MGGYTCRRLDPPARWQYFLRNRGAMVAGYSLCFGLSYGRIHPNDNDHRSFRPSGCILRSPVYLRCFAGIFLSEAPGSPPIVELQWPMLSGVLRI